MGDRYAITGNQNASPAGGTPTCLALEADADTRAKLYDIVFGSPDVPQDIMIEWIVQRFTVAGTRTAVVPALLDPGQPPAQCQGGENHTVEPTYTAATELFDEGIHQRATFRFIAVPGGEFTVPAVAANGIAARCVHATQAPLMNCTMHFEE